MFNNNSESLNKTADSLFQSLPTEPQFLDNLIIEEEILLSENISLNKEIQIDFKALQNLNQVSSALPEFTSTGASISQTLGSVITSNQNVHPQECACLSCCALPAVDPELAENGFQESPVFSTIDTANTFYLNSLPGSNQTIYLDFDGHTTVGTSWNIFFGRSSIVTPKFDFDGNTASFSAAELERIQYIWERVAEDFAPFNVNVTTQAPTDVNDLIKSGSTDTKWGKRVVIGGSSYDWYGQSAGGVAFTGSFNANTDLPTFVFDDQLGNGNEKYTAEAASHEVGHTLGLAHDGRTTPVETYYYGHGSGQTGWAPILGAGYYQNLSQWSKGQYNSANQLQDDLQIITTQNGFDYRVDDTGNSIGTAKPLTVLGTNVSSNGLIERNTDIDYYSFSTGSGLINLDITPAIRGANLDILAELYDSTGTLITSSNPTDFLSANLSASVAAGTYYLKIDGVGKGDALGTGYTDYGSLGRYFINGSIFNVPAPTISISDVTITEGNSGTTNANFIVSLSSAALSDVTVNYSTADGTATDLSDYITTISSVTFAAGETSKTLTTVVNGDTLIEADETFSVNLTTPTNATIADSQAVATILNDDLPAISISDVTITEGNSGTTNANFIVSLSSAALSDVTVNYATADGTATDLSDYITTTSSVTFAAGETSKTLTTVVNGDTLIEADETFFINLTTPTNATIADNQAVATILNDDLPAISISDVTITEGNSGTTNANFIVSLSSAALSDVTVNYATADGTATDLSDYITTTSSVTFAAGETSKTLTTVVNGDTLIEADETFFINLSTPTNATIADNQAVATILNDDLPAISISDVTITEGNSGTTNANFIVSLSSAALSDVTVNYATADGTATALSDYIQQTGTMTFAAGETSKTLTKVVNGDILIEADETFFINLSTPTNATIADNQAVATILNDDLPAISISDVTITEGNSGTTNANFIVSLSSAALSDVTVNYATADGTATALSDYIQQTGTMTFAAGETSKTLTKVVNGDTLIEADETFFINLTTPTNATIADNQGVATILNDDATVPVIPSFSINDVSITEGNSGTKNAVFTIFLSSAATQNVNVYYETANETAAVGSDYTFASGRLILYAGSTQRSFNVPIIGDTLSELNETFKVNLRAPTNATIADNQGIGTILNDDTVVVIPSLSINDVSITEGNSGTTNATFAVSLSSAAVSPITVNYATADGTATAGTDYPSATGTVTFAVGETSKTLTTVINGDTLIEANETFSVNLTTPTNATIVDSQGIGTILNDDTVVVIPSLSINDVSITEGNSGTTNATFAVSLSSAAASPITVNYATANGTATVLTDYLSATGTVTFAVGETSKTLTTVINGDTLIEANETFSVNLTTPTNATIADSQGVATIVNDDILHSFNNNVGLSNPTQLIGFEDLTLPRYASLTNQYPGINFSGATFFDSLAPEAFILPNMTGNRIANFVPNKPTKAFSISFNSDVNAVGFSLISQTGTTTITALNNGQILESQTFGSSLNSTNNFFGFKDLLLDQIKIYTNSSDKAFELDNLQYI